MLIKVIKSVVASKNKYGIESLNYQVGEVYDIYEELAQVFIKEKWGIKANNNLEEKALNNLENKAIDNLENKEVNKNAE